MVSSRAFRQFDLRSGRCRAMVYVMATKRSAPARKKLAATKAEATHRPFEQLARAEKRKRAAASEAVAAGSDARSAARSKSAAPKTMAGPAAQGSDSTGRASVKPQ